VIKEDCAMKKKLITLIESCTDERLIRALFIAAAHYLLRKK
jgi:hypothetical protein